MICPLISMLIARERKCLVKCVIKSVIIGNRFKAIRSIQIIENIRSEIQRVAQVQHAGGGGSISIFIFDSLLSTAKRCYYATLDSIRRGGRKNDEEKY